MTYWVKRIRLKSGEIVTERELRHDENLFAGPAPIVGDKMIVTCRGRKFEARVIWGPVRRCVRCGATLEMWRPPVRVIVRRLGWRLL